MKRNIRGKALASLKRFTCFLKSTIVCAQLQITNTVRKLARIHQKAFNLTPEYADGVLSLLLTTY